MKLRDWPEFDLISPFKVIKNLLYNKRIFRSYIEE